METKMKNVKRVKKRLISYLLAICITISILPSMSTTAYAGFTNTEILNKQGTTLKNNTIYTVVNNITLDGNEVTIIGGNAASALSVEANATTVIYIPEGITLTVKGGNGQPGYGGGAGILLPESSTLIITGGGTLKATGGNGGSAGSGTNGGGWNKNRNN